MPERPTRLTDDALPGFFSRWHSEFAGRTNLACYIDRKTGKMYLIDRHGDRSHYATAAMSSDARPWGSCYDIFVPPTTDVNDAEAQWHHFERKHGTAGFDRPMEPDLGIFGNDHYEGLLNVDRHSGILMDHHGREQNNLARRYANADNGAYFTPFPVPGTRIAPNPKTIRLMWSEMEARHGDTNERRGRFSPQDIPGRWRVRRIDGTVFDAANNALPDRMGHPRLAAIGDGYYAFHLDAIDTPEHRAADWEAYEIREEWREIPSTGMFGSRQDQENFGVPYINRTRSMLCDRHGNDAHRLTPPPLFDYPASAGVTSEDGLFFGRNGWSNNTLIQQWYKMEIQAARFPGFFIPEDQLPSLIDGGVVGYVKYHGTVHYPGNEADAFAVNLPPGRPVSVGRQAFVFHTPEGTTPAGWSDKIPDLLARAYAIIRGGGTLAPKPEYFVEPGDLRRVLGPVIHDQLARYPDSPVLRGLILQKTGIFVPDDLPNEHIAAFVKANAGRPANQPPVMPEGVPVPASLQGAPTAVATEAPPPAQTAGRVTDERPDDGWCIERENGYMYHFEDGEDTDAAFHLEAPDRMGRASDRSLDSWYIPVRQDGDRDHTEEEWRAYEESLWQGGFEEERDEACWSIHRGTGAMYGVGGTSVPAAPMPKALTELIPLNGPLWFLAPASLSYDEAVQRWHLSEVHNLVIQFARLHNMANPTMDIFFATEDYPSHVVDRQAHQVVYFGDRQDDLGCPFESDRVWPESERYLSMWGVRGHLEVVWHEWERLYALAFVGNIEHLTRIIDPPGGRITMPNDGSLVIPCQRIERESGNYTRETSALGRATFSFVSMAELAGECENRDQLIERLGAMLDAEFAVDGEPEAREPIFYPGPESDSETFSTANMNNIVNAWCNLNPDHDPDVEHEEDESTEDEEED